MNDAAEIVQNNSILFLMCPVFPYRNIIPALHEFYSNLKKVRTLMSSLACSQLLDQ